MIEIEIDGKTISVAPGSMIIEAADAAGIPIPRFCYHKKLSVAANCRMCLIEVEKVGKPLPACATPVTAGMKIFTQSNKAIDAQKSVMEFLLINHPLDCPICDQGGACELQDIAMGYGSDFSRYEESRRSVKDENLGSLIATDMTRCIQCTRCVRFGQEIAGCRELGTIGRGDRMEIGTFLKEQAIKSELSGNVIDLCPVGALTSRPFRFTARAWELDQMAAIAAHDCVGSNIFLQTRRNQVMRVAPRENEQVNESWISDRDRFSYQGLYSDDRLVTPLIKTKGKWHETDWTTALNKVAQQLKAQKEKGNQHEIAGIISPNSTVEELYLFQKLLRSIGCNNIDHRLQQTDYSDQAYMPLFPGLPIPIEQLQDQELILLVGSHLNHEQPLLAHRVRKAYLQGAKVLCLNSIDYDFSFNVTEQSIVAPQNIPQQLSAIADGNFWENYFAKANKKVILLGALALNHPEAALIRSYVQAIAEKYQATVGFLTAGSNSTGAWLAGCIPHRGAAGESITLAGKSAQQVFSANCKNYLLFNVEPALDCAYPAVVTQALRQADFVVAFSAYKAKSLLTAADVILPIAAFAETSGTYINIEGRWQSFQASTMAQHEARPGWKVLRVLGNLLQEPHFDYISSEQVRDELQQLLQNMPTRAPVRFTTPKPSAKIASELQRVTEWPLYRSDMVVRRGEALQLSAANEPLVVSINSHLAHELALKSGVKVKVEQEQQELVLLLHIDNRIADKCVVVPAGYDETAVLGNSFGAITISAYHD